MKWKIMIKSMAGKKFAEKPGSQQASWPGQCLVRLFFACVNKLDCPATCAERPKQTAWNDQQVAK